MVYECPIVVWIFCCKYLLFWSFWCVSCTTDDFSLYPYCSRVWENCSFNAMKGSISRKDFRDYSEVNMCQYTVDSWPLSIRKKCFPKSNRTEKLEVRGQKVVYFLSIQIFAWFFSSLLMFFFRGTVKMIKLYFVVVQNVNPRQNWKSELGFM